MCVDIEMRGAAITKRKLPGLYTRQVRPNIRRSDLARCNRLKTRIHMFYVQLYMSGTLASRTRYILSLQLYSVQLYVERTLTCMSEICLRSIDDCANGYGHGGFVGGAYVKRTRCHMRLVAAEKR